MKKLVFLFSFITFQLAGQSLTTKSFNYPLPIGVSDVVQLPGGDLIMTASASPASYDSTMAILMRVDTGLNVKWSKRYKVLRKDDFSVVKVLADGNLLVGGAMRQQFTLNTGACLYKLDTAGNVLWQTMYDGSGDDRVLNVFELPDNTLMLIIRYGVTNRAARILHLSNTGVILSQREYDHGSFGVGSEAAVEGSSGNFFVSGNFFNASVPAAQFYVMSFDTSGFSWFKYYDFGRLITSSYIARYTPDNHLILAGAIHDTQTVSGTNIWVAKLDVNGNVVWANEYHQSQTWDEAPSDISIQPNNEILLVGRVSTDTSRNTLLLKLNKNGGIRWSRAYSQYPYESGSIIYPLQDGRLLMGVGATNNPNYFSTIDTSGVAGCGNIAVSLLAANLTLSTSTNVITSDNPMLTVAQLPDTAYSLGVGLQLVCASHTNILERALLEPSLYPNPVKEELRVQIPKEITQPTISLIDVFGRVATVRFTYKNGSAVVDLRQMPEGIYVIQIAEHDGSWHWQQKILKTD